MTATVHSSSTRGRKKLSHLLQRTNRTVPLLFLHPITPLPVLPTVHLPPLLPLPLPLCLAALNGTVHGLKGVLPLLLEMRHQEAEGEPARAPLLGRGEHQLVGGPVRDEGVQDSLNGRQCKREREQ